MTPANNSLLQALKWQHNNAADITLLLEKQQQWVDQYLNGFWDDWYRDVFDLRTANIFGILVWCIILDLPASDFNLYDIENPFAFGMDRQNYIYSGAAPIPADANIEGGNFYGAGRTAILELDEMRKLLRTRYVHLISNGSIAFINRMLRYIWNDDQPWNWAAGQYFYLADCNTGVTDIDGVPIGPTSAPYLLEYRIGAGMQISQNAVNFMHDPKYNVLPLPTGCRYVVSEETYNIGPAIVVNENIVIVEE